MPCARAGACRSSSPMRRVSGSPRRPSMTGRAPISSSPACSPSTRPTRSLPGSWTPARPGSSATRSGPGCRSSRCRWSTTGSGSSGLGVDLADARRCRCGCPIRRPEIRTDRRSRARSVGDGTGGRRRVRPGLGGRGCRLNPHDRAGRTGIRGRTPDCRCAYPMISHVLAEGDPLVWQRLMREHVPRADGRCASCSLGAGHGRPHWPCRLHDVAAAAAALVRARGSTGE
jgi:hypothetical protein